MKYDTLVFDIDWTIVDSIKQNVEAYKSAFIEFWLKKYIDDIEKIISNWLSIKSYLIKKRIKKEIIENILELKLFLFDIDAIEWKEDIINYINNFDWYKYVCSNASEENIKYYLEKFNIKTNNIFSRDNMWLKPYKLKWIKNAIYIWDSEIDNETSKINWFYFLNVNNEIDLKFMRDSWKNMK